MAEAPPWTAAPEPQNEQPSQSFVASLAKPLTTTDADDSDEWEYEYSTTETETFYLTLDLTTPSIPTSRPVTVSSRNGRAGFRAKWLNPGLGKRRHNLGQAPTLSIHDKDEEVVDVDAPGETDPEAQVEEEEAAEDDQTAAQVPQKEKKIQILDLESDNPLISFRDHIFTCQWAKNIGTELLFTKHDDKANLPTLRRLPQGVDLLGACSARITSTTATIVKTQKDEVTNPLQKEADGPLVESVSAAASDDRRQQARFLERLMKIKKRKDEKDEVTVIAYKRLRRSQWIDLLNRKRNEEREELKKRLKKAEGNEKRDIEKRLAQLDEEEKNMPDAKEAREEEGEDAEVGAPRRPGRNKRRPGRKKTIMGQDEDGFSATNPKPTNLRTGERVDPVRRRPRGTWKRYNIDGTQASSKIAGDKDGKIWKGWHQGMQEKEGAGKVDMDNHDDEDDGGQDHDGDEQMTDARGRRESSFMYETDARRNNDDLMDRRSSMIGYDDSQMIDARGHRESSFIGYETDARHRDADMTDRRSSMIGYETYEEGNQSMHRASSFAEYDHNLPHARSYPGSRMFTRESSAVSTHSAPYLPSGGMGEIPNLGPQMGIGFRDDHQSSRAGSPLGRGMGIGFRNDEPPRMLPEQGNGNEGPGVPPEAAPASDPPVAPPGGWLGLLEDDDIQLPDHQG